MPAPIRLHSKAATVYKRVMNDKFESDRGIGALSAFALAASEENGRGHLVITAPTGGSAGVMPALVYGLLESNTFLVQLRILHRRDRAGSLTNLGTAADQRRRAANLNSVIQQR